MSSNRGRTTDNAVNAIVNSLADRLVPMIGSHFRNSIGCCPNCEHWDEAFERCNLNNQRPPATIIAFGCEMFTDNGLPF